MQYIGQALNQLIIALELLTTAFDRGADIRCKPIRLVVGMITAQHQEQRVHGERLPLHPLELANVMQTGQHLGEIIRVEDHAIGGQALGQLVSWAPVTAAIPRQQCMEDCLREGESPIPYGLRKGLKAFTSHPRRGVFCFAVRRSM